MYGWFFTGCFMALGTWTRRSCAGWPMVRRSRFAASRDSNHDRPVLRAGNTSAVVIRTPRSGSRGGPPCAQSAVSQRGVASFQRGSIAMRLGQDMHTMHYRYV